MDVLPALLANPKAALLDAAEGTTSLAKLLCLTVEIRYRKSPLGGLLNLIYLIRALLYSNEIARTEHVLQLRNASEQDSLKGIQLKVSKWRQFDSPFFGWKRTAGKADTTWLK
jgi:hypothetical protein